MFDTRSSFRRTLCCTQVPYFAEAFPLCDPDGRRRVALQRKADGRHTEKFRKRESMPRRSAAPETTAASSASPGERAMVGWVRDHDFRQTPHHMMAPPVVDFHVSVHPAKLESTNATTSLDPEYHGMRRTTRYFTRR